MTRSTLSNWLARKWLSVSAPQLFFASFALLISVGTAGLLWLPGINMGEPLGFVDALFTATSAVCVTGLIVVDTATHFTRWGQAWLLLLFQLGGLGLITMTSLIIGAMGRRLSLRTEMVTTQTLEGLHGEKLIGLTGRIIRFTLVTEAVIAFALWLVWIPRFGVLDAAWYAVFHSVSAFCNAGFSTFSDSVVSFASSPPVLLLLSFAIVIGGFGYFSGAELWRWLRAGRAHGGRRMRRRLSVHTYAAATATAALLVLGTVAYAALEWNGVLGELGFVDRLVNAWFMSASGRTAGFNAIAYDQLNNGSAFVTILLMVIGGSPGSTAGGIKTTALVVLAALAWSRMRGRRYVRLHDRSVPRGTVERTVSLAILFFTLLAAANLILSFTESHAQTVAESRQAFLPLMFEATSAGATVGLSMGATANLSSAGRILMVLMMFIGRVGPLAFFATMSVKTHKVPSTFRPAAEDIIVG